MNTAGAISDGRALPGPLRKGAVSSFAVTVCGCGPPAEPPLRDRRCALTLALSNPFGKILEEVTPKFLPC